MKSSANRANQETGSSSVAMKPSLDKGRVEARELVYSEYPGLRHGGVTGIPQATRGTYLAANDPEQQMICDHDPIIETQ